MEVWVEVDMKESSITFAVWEEKKGRKAFKVQSDVIHPSR
jgi:hypothetical protein